jgi:hypothetical protein
LGDLSIVSGVENRTIICGSLVSSTSTDFAKTIAGSVFPTVRDSLEINGQIGLDGPVQVLAGSLAINSSTAHAITMTDNISYTLDGRTVLIQKGNQGAKITVNANLTDKCAKITNDIMALSSELAALVHVSAHNISIPTSAAAPLNFYVNKVHTNWMVVFYMDGNTAVNVLVTNAEVRDPPISIPSCM